MYQLWEVFHVSTVFQGHHTIADSSHRPVYLLGRPLDDIPTGWEQLCCGGTQPLTSRDVLLSMLREAHLILSGECFHS